MIQLPFGCYCSHLKVSPKNWEKIKSLTRHWFIYYRFYDPLFKEDPKYKKGKLVVVKGMNQYKVLHERKSHTLKSIEKELQNLRGGFNPITGNFLKPAIMENLVEPSTGFIKALTAAYKSVQVSELTKRDLRGVLSMVTTAAKQLYFFEVPIQTISRKHIKAVLNQIEANMGFPSAHRYNKLRSYLMILFKELIELEATEMNPLLVLSKRKTTRNLRKVLSPSDRKVINDYLKEHHFRFWVFVHIFFHSGARITEILEVKGKHINLDKMVFRLLIKKDSFINEVEKPIKNIALCYWELATKDCKPDEYVFSKGLVPGETTIKPYQITKRWNRHIKKKLGIEEDFYSLKHLNLDETSAILGLKDSAAMASHNSIAVTEKYYAVNESTRQMERLQKVQNPFA